MHTPHVKVFFVFSKSSPVGVWISYAVAHYPSKFKYLDQYLESCLVFQMVMFIIYVMSDFLPLDLLDLILCLLNCNRGSSNTCIIHLTESCPAFQVISFVFGIQVMSHFVVSGILAFLSLIQHTELPWLRVSQTAHRNFYL